MNKGRLPSLFVALSTLKTVPWTCWKAQKGSLEVKVPSVEKIWIASISPTILDYFALERYMHKPGKNGDDEEGVEDDKEHNHPVREVKLAQNIWKDQQGCQKTTWKWRVHNLFVRIKLSFTSNSVPCVRVIWCPVEDVWPWQWWVGVERLPASKVVVLCASHFPRREGYLSSNFTWK